MILEVRGTAIITARGKTYHWRPQAADFRTLTDGSNFRHLIWLIDPDTGFEAELEVQEAPPGHYKTHLLSTNERGVVVEDHWVFLCYEEGQKG